MALWLSWQFELVPKCSAFGDFGAKAAVKCSHNASNQMRRSPKRSNCATKGPIGLNPAPGCSRYSRSRANSAASCCTRLSGTGAPLARANKRSSCEIWSTKCTPQWRCSVQEIFPRAELPCQWSSTSIPGEIRRGAANFAPLKERSIKWPYDVRLMDVILTAKFVRSRACCLRPMVDCAGSVRSLYCMVPGRPSRLIGKLASGRATKSDIRSSKAPT